VSSNITVITSEEIESTSSITLDELLFKKGFKIIRYPGGSLSTIQIRGFSTDAHGNDLGSHVLIVLNGRRIATGNSSMVALANVERVEIIRGPAAVQYGASAMGGVVNIITRKGVGQPFKALISATGGSFDSFNGNARFSGSNQNFDFSGGFRYDSQGNVKAGHGLEFLNSDYKTYAVTMGAGYTFEDVHRVGVDINYFANPDGGSPGTYPQSNSAKSDRIDKTNLSIGLNYEGATPDNRFTWQGVYAYGKDERDYKNIWGLSETSEYDVNSHIANGLVTYHAKMLDLTVGIDYLKYELSSNEVALASHGSVYSDLAGFAIAKLKFLQDSVIVSLGGRYDSYSIKLKDTGKNSKTTNFAPSVGVVYLPFDFLKFRAHFAEAFAMPTEGQLGSNFIYGNYKYVGNPNLSPETSTTYEAGVDLMGSFSNISATYFFIKSKNFIGNYSLGTVDGYLTTSYRNNDVAYRSGLEIQGGIDFGALFDKDFSLKTTVNYTHFFTSKTRNRPTDPYTPILLGLPKDALTFAVYFKHYNSDFMVNVSTNFIGKQSNSTSATNPPTSYTTYDLVLQKRIWQFKDSGKISARVEVNNISDKLYATNTTRTYYMPGRNFHAALVYEY
jgi:vitamin B12 transporter